MILYSDRDDHYSQRVRIVLAEKDIAAEIKEVSIEETPDDILSISPYQKLPILVDRELALHDPSVMMEYLDERFPHPPLLPVDPVARAKFRLALDTIEHQWYPDFNHAYKDGNLDPKFVDKISNYFLEIIPLISDNFFMSEDFGLVDCSLAPLLWRIKSLGIELKENKDIIDKYSKRIFDRASFQESLSETEKDF